MYRLARYYSDPCFTCPPSVSAEPIFIWPENMCIRSICGKFRSSGKKKKGIIQPGKKHLRVAVAPHATYIIRHPCDTKPCIFHEQPHSHASDSPPAQNVASATVHKESGYAQTRNKLSVSPASFFLAHHAVCVWSSSPSPYHWLRRRRRFGAVCTRGHRYDT